MNKDEMQKKLDLVRDRSKLPAGFGDALGRFQIRYSNNPVSRWLIRHVFTPTLAFLIATFRLFGIRKGKTPAEIMYNWQRLAAVMKVTTVVESVSDEEVVIVHPHCTMGYNDASHRALCSASMNMDHELVHRLGGELTILHRRLDGGEDICRHVVRIPKPAGAAQANKDLVQIGKPK